MIRLLEPLLTSALHQLEADGRPVPHKAWQRGLSKVIRTLLPAPHQSHWMEWEYGTWVGAFAGFDEVGRQLGEANVLPEWMAAPLDDRWRPFKGPGIRNGHPFNVDAMQEMAQCWDGLLLDAGRLRDLYCQRFQRTGVLSALDLYVMTSIAVSLSSFLLRRGDAPVADGALPRRVSAAFKVLGGMYAATNRMMSQAHPMLLEDELDADRFLQYLEDEHLLLSPEMRACAGPVKMIRQILATLVEPAVTNMMAQANYQQEQGLDYLGVDIEQAFDYGLCCVRIDNSVLLHWRSLRQCLLPMLADSTTPDAVKSLLEQEDELGIKDDTPLTAYVQVAQALLMRIGISTEESHLLATLPLGALLTDVDSGSKQALVLEKAMQVFAGYQQAELDQVLQRRSHKLPNGWSPAPASAFLQHLLKADKRLSGVFKVGAI